MAIGLGKMFGFEFLRKLSLSVRVNQCDGFFWRRWHISLSTWFREYVYIPLGGNRKRGFQNHLQSADRLDAAGFWHGAAWNFLAWGLYYGIILVLEKFVWGQYVEKLPNAVKHIYAMVFVSHWMGAVLSSITGICTEIYWCDVWNWCQWADGQAGMVLFAVELANLS